MDSRSGRHLLSQFISLAHGSANCPKNIYLSGSTAFQGAVNCIYKFAGALFVLLSDGSNQNFSRLLSNSHGPQSKDCQSCMQIKHVTVYGQDFAVAGLLFGSISQLGINVPLVLANVATSTIGRLCREVEQLQGSPILSLAAALVPPSDQVSSRVLSLPSKNPAEQFGQTLKQAPCVDDCQGSANLSFSNVSMTKDRVEPKTGIKFPTILDNHLFGEDSTEVLVRTGYRSVRVVKVKSLNVYAFGLYVCPDSVCEKLGPKYAYVPAGELKNSSDFYGDLLREDIHMTVRLVVNYNGLKVSTVRDAFEKSLKSHLQKINPNTDYHCIKAFGSYFNQDFPLPVGTAIDFKRTVEGQFITEIGGKTIGAVHSRDLCRAFFNMYIGDLPVSVQAKEDIAANVACLIRRC